MLVSTGKPVQALIGIAESAFRQDNSLIYYNNTIIHFIETGLQYNWHNNKHADGLVNRLASNLVVLNQAHLVAWLIGEEKILK